MYTEAAVATRGMMVQRGDRNLPWCCARCGYEGQPLSYRDCTCPGCERPDDYEDIERELDEEDRVRAFGKVGRNEPCPCGSGKKFKKCCGG